MVSKTIKEKQFMDELYDNLTQGDITSSLKLYNKYTRIFDNLDFVDRILKRTLTEIKDDFTNKKISVAEKHVATNVAATLAKIIADNQNKENS